MHGGPRVLSETSHASHEASPGLRRSPHLSWLFVVLVSPTTVLPGCASFQSLPRYPPSTPGPTTRRSCEVELEGSAMVASPLRFKDRRDTDKAPVTPLNAPEDNREAPRGRVTVMGRTMELWLRPSDRGNIDRWECETGESQRIDCITSH